MSKWWLGVALVGLLGCTSNQGSPPRVSCFKNPCTVHYVVRVDPSFTSDERREVWQGLRSWTRSTYGTVCFSPQEPQNGFNLVVVRGEDQQSLRPYLDTWKESAAIYKDGSIVLAMDVSRPDVPGVVAHEAGHALGLPHSEDTHAVMNRRTGRLIEGYLPPTDTETFVRLRCK